jgi:hypothetical protein
METHHIIVILTEKATSHAAVSHLNYHKRGQNFKKYIP